MPEPPGLDRRIGILCYYKNWSRIPGRLRSRLSDFVVDEIWGGASATESASGLRSPNVDEGPHAVFVVIKFGQTTLAAAAKLAEVLRIPVRKVSFAGLKDKRAVAAQFMSAPVGRPPDFVRFRDVLIRFVCRSERPVSRGSNSGNRFVVVVRGTASLELSARLRELAGGFPNFFSYQRFGDREPLNHELGRLILQRRFREAVERIASKPEGGSYERKVGEALRRGEDPLRALKKIGRSVLELLVHSYQAYIFNRLLSMRISERKLEPAAGDPTIVDENSEPILALPLPGVGTTLPSGWAKSKMEELLSEDGLTLNSFDIPELGLTCRGELRPAIAYARNLRVLEMQGILAAHFVLPRGVYATSLLREALLPSDPSAQGFL